jgi:hypothetical protein
MQGSIIPDHPLTLPSGPLASSPPCRGRAREGVEARLSQRVYPHPTGPLASLSPSPRGKEHSIFVDNPK